MEGGNVTTAEAAGRGKKKQDTEVLHGIYVSQEQFLFNMSLYDNILLGKPDATREEVLAAAKIVQQGKHEELMREEGIYKRFVQSRELAAGWKL